MFKYTPEGFLGANKFRQPTEEEKTKVKNNITTVSFKDIVMAADKNTTLSAQYWVKKSKDKSPYIIEAGAIRKAKPSEYHRKDTMYLNQDELKQVKKLFKVIKKSERRANRLREELNKFKNR